MSVWRLALQDTKDLQIAFKSMSIKPPILSVDIMVVPLNQSCLECSDKIFEESPLTGNEIY